MAITNKTNIFNDNRIISDQPARRTHKYIVESERVTGYAERLRHLLQEGAPIGFIGFQSRFGTHVPPEIIYKRLCFFNEFKLPIVATEFEVKKPLADNEHEAALLTEEALTIYFSHPLCDGIYAWTLLPNSKSEGREILHEDGRPNLRGKVWLYLIKNRWSTRIAAKTGSNGATPRLRGFKGLYRFSVFVNGKKKTVEADVSKNRVVRIRL